ncbi:META domain-containing protein [Leptolyngbyaceae cyanobacterium UHCC 1019]
MNPKISFNLLTGCIVTLVVGSVGVAIANPILAQNSAAKPSVLVAQSGAIQGSWRLANMTQPGSPMPMLPSTEQTVEFSAGRITGSGGCNRFNGTYRTAQGNQLSIGTLATTFMACEAGVMTQESTFLTALQAAQRYQVNRDGLQINYRTPQGTAVLRFTSQATPTPTPIPTPTPTPPPRGRTYQNRGIASGSIFTQGRQTNATLTRMGNNFTFRLETPSLLGLKMEYGGTETRTQTLRNGFILTGRVRNLASSATLNNALPAIGSCRIEVLDSRVVSSYCDMAIKSTTTRFQGVR